MYHVWMMIVENFINQLSIYVQCKVNDRLMITTEYINIYAHASRPVQLRPRSYLKYDEANG
jgi:hypothetical protein